jgi:hypothetical protein
MKCDTCIGQIREQKKTRDGNDDDDGKGDSDQAIGKKINFICVHVLHNNYIGRNSLDIA